MFLPPATQRARLVVQQVVPAGCCASLTERQREAAVTRLHVYATAGDTPPAVPTERPRRSHPPPLGQMLSLGDEGVLYLRGLVNSSASDGELSLELDTPEPRWLHVLIHAARVEADGAEYDVRIEADRGAHGALGADGASRHDTLEAIGWRYRVDPDGPSHVDPWVLERHLNPMS